MQTSRRNLRGFHRLHGYRMEWSMDRSHSGGRARATRSRPLLGARFSSCGGGLVKREVMDRLPLWVRVLEELAEQSDLRESSASR